MALFFPTSILELGPALFSQILGFFLKGSPMLDTIPNPLLWVEHGEPEWTIWVLKVKYLQEGEESLIPGIQTSYLSVLFFEFLYRKKLTAQNQENSEGLIWE
jgi:hypothetical protein